MMVAPSNLVFPSDEATDAFPREIMTLPSPSPVRSHQVLFVFCVPETASGKWRAAYGLAKDTVRYLCESNGAEVDKDIQVSSGAQMNETYLDALCDTDF